MQYEPIKRSVGRFFTGPLFMRRILYLLLDLLLLRTWHVKKALRKIARQFPGDASVLDAGSGFGQYYMANQQNESHVEYKGNRYQ